MLPLLLLGLEVQSTPLPHDSYTASLPQTSAKRTKMADFRIFVTAASADFKVINEMLVYLRDWEDGSGDTFYLQTNNTIEESLETSEEPVAIPVAVPGNFTAESFDTNAWAGASMAEVETFATQELDHIASPQAHVSFFLVLDEQGVDDHTVLCVAKDEPEDSDDEDEDEDDDGGGDGDGKVHDRGDSQPPATQDSKKRLAGADDANYVARYNKVRMPWHVAYSFCANLGESNMGFEEFCDQDVGPDERLFWMANEDLTEDDLNGEDAMRRRGKFLEKLKKEGLV